MPTAYLLSDLSAALDRSLPIPLGVQLRGLIEYGIACGELPPGTRLPSVRELAGAGGLAPMTVATVYKEMQENGLIAARAGSGTFVAEHGMDGRVEALMRVRSHIDSALSEAETAGISASDVASLLNARIGRGKAREGRGVRIAMVGMFQEATKAYAQEIARHLRAGDSIDAMTFATLDQRDELAADLYITFANRRSELEAIVAGRAPVTAVSFIPAERTRALLAAIDPLSRLGIVSLVPEFLALMKPSVQRFAPHVASVSATVLADEALPAFLSRVDVIVYATGAEAVLDRLPSGILAIEYRHAPDPHSVQTVLLPQVERIRNR